MYSTQNHTAAASMPISKLSSTGGRTSEMSRDDKRADKRAESQKSQAAHPLEDKDEKKTTELPPISLPKGGGAIRSLGEKFATNPQTGAAGLTVPIPTTGARGDSKVALSLSYNSSSGNGAFGYGWQLTAPSITRKTDKGLPRYLEDGPEDVFIFASEEDLVPVLEQTASGWQTPAPTLRGQYNIKRYRPRIEGSFRRIEKWTNTTDHSDIFWRTMSRDNVTMTFGRTANSQIYSDEDQGDGTVVRRIFSWLISDTFDTIGNAAIYIYQEDNGAGIDKTASSEVNRTPTALQSNRYPKSIKYGNRSPNRDANWASFDPHMLPDSHGDENMWMFEVVFDYGDHDASNPQVSPTIDPPVRENPFSVYRAGFEVRTYRLCRRVLMFHHFKAELGVSDYLVSSVQFQYDESPVASFLTSAVSSGFIQNGTTVIQRSLPPLEFEYSKAPDSATLADLEVKELDSHSLENLPSIVDGSECRWIDLDGEGIPGVLCEAGSHWYYKRNISPSLASSSGSSSSSNLAELGPLTPLSSKPPGVSVKDTPLMDIDGNGLLDALQMHPEAGFYARKASKDWEPFHLLKGFPNLDFNKPDVKFLDVTGDGLVDVIVFELDALTFYHSNGVDGFDNPLWVRVPWGADGSDYYSQHPRAIFSHGAMTMHIADMSGDGLPDLVRISDGQVLYYPNLGYGRFGDAVEMTNSPQFTSCDTEFDPERLRMADIDGSGTTDILYLGLGGVTVFLNQSGNSWSDTQLIAGLTFEYLTSVTVIDLLGKGTACIVWSEHGASELRIRYVDLMAGGMKPHLLTLARNNTGAETHIEYSPSTAYYMDDLRSGKPWATKLPMVVQCVSKSTLIDHLSDSTYVSRYAYHHGCFNGVEREFCGFAFVEKWDADEVSPEATSNLSIPLPPVHTKSWYHTGVEVDDYNHSLIQSLARDFFGALVEGSNFDAYLATLIEMPAYDLNISAEDAAEAIRALKGAVLREETYADDDSDKAMLPYSISQSMYSIELIQPKVAGNVYASMHLLTRGGRSETYERIVADPRLSQTFNLQYDKYGIVLKSIAISLGRTIEDTTLAPTDRLKQSQLSIEYTENDMTGSIDTDDDYLLGVNCETRSFEITGLSPVSAPYFKMEEFTDNSFGFLSSLQDVPFEDTMDVSLKQKRLIHRFRTLYRSNDLSQFLPIGHTDTMNFLGESYQLVFTPGMLTNIFQRQTAGSNGPAEQLIPDPKTTLGGTGQGQGGYKDLDSDGNWWAPSGRQFFHEDPTATSAVELATARSSFYRPRSVTTPFGDKSTTQYDADNLLKIQSTDAANSTISADNDYRLCQPYRVTDANGNHSQIATDALGIVVGTAVYGKTTAEGDSLDGFDPHPPQSLLDQYFADPKSAATPTLLGNATTRMIYDPNRYYNNRSDTTKKWPMYSSSISREIHVSDLSAPSKSNLQVSFSYSDGVGRELQRKVQGDAETPDRAWVGSGWNVYNNKGLMFRQYEPFFDTSHEFMDVNISGVSATFFYDSASRLVATLHPDHSWEKVVFDSWKQVTWDANDTISISPDQDSDYGYLFKLLPSSDYSPTWTDTMKSIGGKAADAADKASKHADTPTLMHFDALGRTFLTVADNGTVGKFETRVTLNIDGSQLDITDSMGRTVIKYDYNVIGTRIRQASMEAGEGWTLCDAISNVQLSWDALGNRVKTYFDALRRPVGVYVLRPGDTTDLLETKTQYGDDSALGVAFTQQQNLRSRAYVVWDQAGMLTNVKYDFKGNLLTSQRKIAVEYKRMLDWTTNEQLDVAGPYEATTTVDAMDRPTLSKTPDNSTTRYTYNTAGLLFKVEANIKNENNGAFNDIVSKIEYDVRGERQSVQNQNGVTTSYVRDPLTHRISTVTATRPSSSGGTELLQSLAYTYDPVGNITYIKDSAQQTIFFRNQVVEPSNDYTYDAVYRLISATGREHVGQAVTAGKPNAPTPPTQFNDFHSRLTAPGDGNAMANYTESYEYDQVGNFKSVKHDSSDPTVPSWTRTYAYNEVSQLGGPLPSNRISSTTIDTATDTYKYDINGNMMSMSAVPKLSWNHKNQLIASSSQVVNSGTPETTYYVYAASGSRARKVTESFATSDQKPHKTKERIYLGPGFQIYREFDGTGNTSLEREVLHINESAGTVCLVESRTVGSDTDGPQRLFRYSLRTQTGSVSIEVDDQAQVISYEEYTPYGSTSFQGIRSVNLETPKLYRYSGAEYDEETGLSYNSARYLLTTIGAWTSADPASMSGGINLYLYAGSNPITRSDRSGSQYVDIGDDPGVKAAHDALRADPPASIANAAPPQSAPLSANPPTSTKAARSLAKPMQASVRRQVRAAHPDLPSHVAVGHTIQVHDTVNSGLHESVTNDPARTQMLNSSRTMGGESGTVTDHSGRTTTYTKHNTQERHIEDKVAVYRAQGLSHADAQVAASDTVRYQHENTHLDWRDAKDLVSGTQTSAKERAEVDAQAARGNGGGGAPHGGGGSGGGGGGSGGSGGGSANHTNNSGPGHAPASSHALPSAPSEHHETPHAPNPTSAAPHISGGGGGPGGGSRIVTTTVGVAGALGRALAPDGFAEGEVALEYLGTMAGAAGHGVTSVVLTRAAGAVPVIGGAMVVGGLAGDAGEYVAKEVFHASGETSQKVGMLSSIVAGAGVGAAIGAPAGGIGALPGAIIGGAVGLGAYLWGR